MGSTSTAHLFSCLLCLLGPLLNLRGVIGFWINSTTNLQSSLSTEFLLNQDFYAILQGTLLKQGQTRVIYSSTKPISDTASWRRPVISPDLAWQRATNRKKPKTGPENPSSHPKNRLISNNIYKKLLDSISQDNFNSNKPHPTSRAEVNYYTSERRDSFTEFKPVKTIYSVFRSVAPRDEDVTNNEIPQETGVNEEDFGNSLETFIAGEKVSSPLITSRMSSLPKMARDKRYDRHVRDEDQYEGLYRDLCRSRSSFQLLSTAVNDALDEVQLLPNTWVWVTKCLRNNSPCPSLASGVVAKCKQKKSWVNAFARINHNDPWRWHWIAVDTSCSCGILDIGLI